MDDPRPGGDGSDDGTDPCTCASPAGTPSGNRLPMAERWLGGSSPMDEYLPADVQAALGRLLGEGPIERLDDWTAKVRERTGGGAIEIDDLCHASADSAHWAVAGGEQYHFLCFYDAVVLSALLDEPVDIRTVSPGGVVIEAVAAGTDELQVTPEEAVFSFGVDDSVEPPADGDPSKQTVYSAVCPFIQAFPDRAAYEQWAGSLPAATVAMPLRGATDLAAALVE